MFRSKRQSWRSLCTAFGLVLGLLPATTAQAQFGGNSVVIPPNVGGNHSFGPTRPYGKTYGEWSAEQWKWAYSLPANQHPLTDTADCSAGQSGPVWFLGGTFAATGGTGPNVVIGTANRSCTIPAGKALFFPLLDAECATLEGNGATETELRACAKSLVDRVTELQASVDGVSLYNLQNYRVQSPLFSYGPLPPNNLLLAGGLADAVPGATSPAISDGYFLMLAPLPVRTHTLHFAGKAVFTQAQDGFDLTFILDINYQLTITP
ncbi:MAG: hypothetical protein HYR56_06495 [Acidobacteria bacterium]|nr:hypothetical protein [Acidobacteriota bacterium]MBI3423924.1 hypothetical protein [Acidobacteriota bacterium]